MENTKKVNQEIIEEFVAAQVSDTAKRFVRSQLERIVLPEGNYDISISDNSLKVVRVVTSQDGNKLLYVINSDGGNELSIRKRVAMIEKSGLDIKVTSSMKEERFNLFLDARPIYQKRSTEVRTGLEGARDVKVEVSQQLTQKSFEKGALSRISIKKKDTQRTKPIGETIDALYSQFERGYCPEFDMEGLDSTYDTLETRKIVNGCYVVTSKALYGGTFDSTVGYVKVNSRGQMDPSLATVGVEMDINQDEATLFGVADTGYRSSHAINPIDITNNVIRKLEKVNPE